MKRTALIVTAMALFAAYAHGYRLANMAELPASQRPYAVMVEAQL